MDAVQLDRFDNLPSFPLLESVTSPGGARKWLERDSAGVYLSLGASIPDGHPQPRLIAIGLPPKHVHGEIAGLVLTGRFGQDPDSSRDPSDWLEVFVHFEDSLSIHWLFGGATRTAGQWQDIELLSCCPVGTERRRPTGADSLPTPPFLFYRLDLAVPFRNESMQIVLRELAVVGDVRVTTAAIASRT